MSSTLTPTIICVISSAGQSNPLLRDRSVVRIHYDAPDLGARLYKATLLILDIISTLSKDVREHDLRFLSLVAD